jgi:kynurenine formamidase
VSGGIKLEDLQQIIKEQNITTRPADVLFLRTGFVSSYNQFSVQEQETYSQATNGYLGFEASRDSLRWLWDSHFSAVASDSPSFERSPLAGAYNEPGVSVHQWGLAGWGMPIGEMFDLENLAIQCRKLGRYSFFISSVPLKVPGGVASPPCAVAIF